MMEEELSREEVVEPVVYREEAFCSFCLARRARQRARTSSDVELASEELSERLEAEASRLSSSASIFSIVSSEEEDAVGEGGEPVLRAERKSSFLLGREECGVKGFRGGLAEASILVLKSLEGEVSCIRLLLRGWREKGPEGIFLTGDGGVRPEEPMAEAVWVESFVFFTVFEVETREAVASLMERLLLVVAVLVTAAA